MINNFPEPQGLYDPVNEHDACGVGFTANIDGSKDHNIISSGLKVLKLVPQAWGEKYPMGNDLRGFFEYHAGMMEPWDGPAAVAFSNGTQTGAELDRNGLRPARYTITKNGFIVFASETGVLDLSSEDIIEKGALRPGEMILVDFNKKRLLKNSEIKNLSARKEPYRRWVKENKITVRGFYGDIDSITPDMEKLFFRKKLFGYTREDERVILASIALKGEEPIGSMGTDSPLAVFNEKNQLLYSYFKQLFAQVTNPPIDPVREELVMALLTFFGNPGNILTETPQNSRLIKLPHPILSNENVRIIKELNIDLFRSKRILIQFPANGTGKELEDALDKLCSKCKKSVEQGYSIIILSDKDLQEQMAPIPALLAVSAVNQHLSRHGLRTAAGIIVETGEAREVMHMALLLGFGATAINPYLAFETIAAMAINEELENKIDVAKALENYIKALCKGLLKIMSKMGISTLRSYRSAQIFQAIGLNSKLVDRYFANTATHVEGIGIDEIAKEAVERYNAASHKTDDIVPFLPAGGRYSLRKDGERHLWTPLTISKLQQATRKNDYNLYKEYAALINNQSKEQSTLRGMFKFKKRDSIPLDKVEPEAEIVKRFVTGAMSFGSISCEAHETIAIAMNRLGAKSNKNTCPVGIATQDSQMRKNFKGSPDYLVNFFTMIAKEVREYMAMLGFSKMNEMIGRTDLLDKNEAVSFWKAKGLDFSKIFYIPKINKNAPGRFMEPQPDVLADALDKELIKEAKAALELKKKVVIERKIHNTNRTVGTMLAGEIAMRYGHEGLDDDTVTCKFFGAAGQSFGAFAARGMTLILEGEANDYVGKGLSGGKIIVKPYKGANFIPQENIIAGNVLLYGATSGELYLNGKAGERFAIRNSGAIAVVEGIGDHGCEYMTGGKIVVLGDTGVNFAAGMSGGIAYIFDPEQQFDQRCNLDMVDLELVTEPKEIRELQELIKQHQQYTGSLKAANILNNFEASLPFFIKVLPMEYRRILGKMSMEDKATKRKEVQHG